MWTVLLSLLYFFAIGRWGDANRVDDVCGTRNVRRVFLEPGESGVLTALNVTPGASVGSNVSLKESCRVDLVSCPSCVVSFTFRFMNLSCYCGARFKLFLHNPCRCDYVWVSEPPYEDSSGMSFFGVVGATGTNIGGLGYKSKTKTVRIWLFFSKAHSHAFTLDYKSEPNRQFVFGTSQESPQLNLSTGFISSPFFPAAYPRDLVTEYVLTCIRHSNFSAAVANGSLDDDNACRVQLTFTDFQLASSSVMEFYEGRRRVGVASGLSFRPPVIVSTTNSLLMRFYASGQASAGFKAVFSFVSENALKEMPKPNTDCGGYVDNFGGTITMMKMVDSETKLFDCVWLIKSFKNFSGVKSQQYLKVTAFRGFVGDAELHIRRGLTSESPQLEELRSPMLQTFREHVIPLQVGFYVSLRAFFGPTSHFSITYALFTQKRCVILPGFMCRNFRCISGKLTCDGFDHCGDNSDEPAVCYARWGMKSDTRGDQKERIQTPNYYFPNVNQYPVVKMVSTVFLLSFMGLIFLISSFGVVLYMIESKSQHQRNIQNELQAVRNFQGISSRFDCLSDEVSVEDVVIDDPPSYEAPPDYDEVVKMPVKKSAIKDFRLFSAEERTECERSRHVPSSWRATHIFLKKYHISCGIFQELNFPLASYASPGNNETSGSIKSLREMTK